VIFFYPGQGDIILTVGAAALFSRFQSPALRPAVIRFLRHLIFATA
jgi:hypothetical protein